MSSKDRIPNTTFSTLFQIISIKLKREADKRIGELGLNSQQGRVIGYIYDHQDEGIIQKDLADVFHKRGATITSMLKGLEKNEYIERRIPSDNERQKNLYVLPKGEKLINDFNEVFSDLENKITSCLTEEELKTLEKLLSKINQSI
ncbi:MAG: winged helix-turn-helix transcriptional regulator [Clostridium baratii]|uniref:MarR family winged helix-turn-helix transcriptional regulator n=1 Tax=Clostridium baratii TaxID=1561 RepID=UPI0006C6E259|nr:MarR family winged helix-turn-helix transcriptional regulator [Clostridium baratii]MBS6005956.1 winged helix-turn-helix transcriptional regulator [Clostridium baratii]MDU1053024.1 MarR family winged helix-turn-helix transcriptional regulator [Clostridium baratii]CUP17625.1 transcriptional regulator [Clostridium baratii]